MNRGAHAYLSTQVRTTSKGELLILLYDAAIKFMKQAKVKINEKDYAAKGVLISKAIEVIAELASSLNKEKGGELAENLNKLYLFCNTRLLLANLRMDTEKIDEVIKIIEGISSAYKEIIPGEDSEIITQSESSGSYSVAPGSGTANLLNIKNNTIAKPKLAQAKRAMNAYNSGR
jgi:flagellar protein FliS